MRTLQPVKPTPILLMSPTSVLTSQIRRIFLPCNPATAGGGAKEQGISLSTSQLTHSRRPHRLQAGPILHSPMKPPLRNPPSSPLQSLRTTPTRWRSHRLPRHPARLPDSLRALARENSHVTQGVGHQGGIKEALPRRLPAIQTLQTLLFSRPSVRHHLGQNSCQNSDQRRSPDPSLAIFHINFVLALTFLMRRLSPPSCENTQTDVAFYSACDAEMDFYTLES